MNKVACAHSSLTFGHPFGQEQVNGRVAGRPADGSRSVAFAISIQNFRQLRNMFDGAGNEIRWGR